MSIEVKLEPNLSLNDLKEQMDQGVSVIRSAHIGNARAYNLAVASMGIPMLLVDHNVVAQFPGDEGDNNYLPGSIVTRTEIQPLKVSRVGGLALQTEVINSNGDVRMLDEFHIDSLRALFPQTEFLTNTQYLRQFEGLAGETLSIAVKTAPQLFRAVVEADGQISRKSPIAAKQSNFAGLVPNYGILQLKDDPSSERGVLIPNEVDIVLNFIIEAIKSERSRQIHLSGPDMYLYIRDPQTMTMISHLYDEVRTTSSFGHQLPDTLEVDLVPVSFAKFATRSPRLYGAMAIFEALRYEELLRDQKAVFMRAQPDREAKNAFLEVHKPKEQAANQHFVQAALGIDEFMVGSRDAPFTSQYDINLKQQEKLVMPSENQTLSMLALKALDKRLSKARGSLP